MAEKKVYDSGDVEELINEVYELVGEDDDKMDDLFGDYDLSNYYSFFGEVMAGGLEEELVCTPEWCEGFCNGLQKLIADLKKNK